MARSRGGRWSGSATRTPLLSTSSPPSTDVSPASIRSSVVLPAPLRPASVSRSRRSSRNETPRSSGSPAMSLARSDAMTTAIRHSRVSFAAMKALKTSLLTACLVLAMAPVALAHDGGEGWYGETDDKVITNAGFVLIAAFPLIIVIASLIQGRLEKRKDARLAAARARRQRADQRGGW